MPIKVTVLGSGTPLPNLRRAGPAFVAHLSDEPVLVDCGPETLRQMMVAGIEPKLVTKVFFTHLHLDHTLGLGQFVIGGWALGRRKMQLFGPPGTRRMKEVLFDDLWKKDIDYRLSLGRPGGGLADIQVDDVGPGPVYQDERMTVTAAEGIHTTYDLAYRFDHDGKSVVFTGDTYPSDAIIELARGAGAIFHDCNLAPSARRWFERSEGGLRVWESLQDHHSTPENAGRVAAAAGVKKLVLIHLQPTADPEEVARLAQTTFSGEVIPSEDLMEIEVG
ncbi:MAG: MBL fold metallo-hydrolase [Chloroflexi bacterium]|nr:MBL fold metallo-hydrolase [Chloroflexota bacterium]